MLDIYAILILSYVIPTANDILDKIINIWTKNEDHGKNAK